MIFLFEMWIFPLAQPHLEGARGCYGLVICISNHRLLYQRNIRPRIITSSGLPHHWKTILNILKPHSWNPFPNPNYHNYHVPRYSESLRRPELRASCAGSLVDEGEGSGKSWASTWAKFHGRPWSQWPSGLGNETHHTMESWQTGDRWVTHEMDLRFLEIQYSY